MLPILSSIGVSLRSAASSIVISVIKSSLCLCYEPMRFSELLKEVKGISGKMLSRELKDLEMNKLVIRKILDTSPVTVTYQISEYVKSLKELTNVIAEWGLKHRERIIHS